MKKHLFLLLLAMLMAIAPARAFDFSAEAPNGQTLYYNINGNEVTLTCPGSNSWSGYTKPVGDLSIPSSVIDAATGYQYTVTSIGNYAFKDCRNLTSVIIPGSVTEIGVDAFYYCNLRSVTFDGTSTLTSIGNSAFKGCKNLTSVIIPGSVTEIGVDAFCDCGLQSVTFDGTSTLTSIGNSAFKECRNLTSVTLPDSVTSIGLHAFDGCCSLTSITIPNSVTSIGDYAFYYCSGLTSVTIGSSVTSIGPSTFKNCSGLTSIVLPSSVTNIGTSAFEGCTNLKTVYNLSSTLNLTPGSNGNGYVAKYAKRVVKPTKFGTGTNAIYQISSKRIVQNETNSPNDIPESTISEHYNFIYKKNGSWISKKIVLTDCQDAFNAPVTFTADHATYTRTFTDGNRSTLCLPFTTTIPDYLDVYEFNDFDDNTIHFTQKESGNIEAYTPYLVGKDLSKSTTDFTFTQTSAVFPATSTAMASAPVTDNNMTFQGVMQRTAMSNNGCWNYGYKDGYFVRSGGSAHVNPFRCYFTWNNAPQNAPASLGVDTDDGGVGIEQPAADDKPTGRIRYSNDVYDLMGRMVRKEASDLRGLPKGIYIWRGKKVIAF